MSLSSGQRYPRSTLIRLVVCIPMTMPTASSAMERKRLCGGGGRFPAGLVNCKARRAGERWVCRSTELPLLCVCISPFQSTTLKSQKAAALLKRLGASRTGTSSSAHRKLLDDDSRSTNQSPRSDVMVIRPKIIKQNVSCCPLLSLSLSLSLFLFFPLEYACDSPHIALAARVCLSRAKAAPETTPPWSTRRLSMEPRISGGV